MTKLPHPSNPKGTQGRRSKSRNLLSTLYHKLMILSIVSFLTVTPTLSPTALEAVNMDTVAAEERIAKLKQELMRAKTPEKIQEISRKIDNIQEMGDRMASKFEMLRKA